MTSTTRIAPPEWIQQIMHEIDTLIFKDGFAHMTDQTDMFFGTGYIQGVEGIKAFFVKIDEPLEITHEVLECWEAGNVYFLRGQATMAKKTDPERVVQAPFMHIYYLADDPNVRIETIRICAGPLQVDAVM